MRWLTLLFCFWLTALANGAVTQLNIRAFGAKGDGVTDDTANVQKAITACVTQGGKIELYFPKGTYRIASTLTMTKPVSLVGEASRGVILSWTGGASRMLYAQSDTAYAQGWAMKCLEFDGNGTALGIEIDNMTEGLIEECIFHEFTQYGIKLTTALQNTLLRCRFRDLSTNTAAGIVFNGGSGHTIIGCSFGTSAKGITFESASNGLCIGPGNVFEGNDTAIEVPRLAYPGELTLNIFSCFFENNTNVWLLGTGSGTRPTGIRFIGNEVASGGNSDLVLTNVGSLKLDGNRFGRKVYVSNATDIVVINNDFWDIVHYGSTITNALTLGNRYASFRTNDIPVGNHTDLDIVELNSTIPHNFSRDVTGQGNISSALRLLAGTSSLRGRLTLKQTGAFYPSSGTNYTSPTITIWNEDGLDVGNYGAIDWLKRNASATSGAYIAAYNEDGSANTSLQFGTMGTNRMRLSSIGDLTLDGWLIGHPGAQFGNLFVTNNFARGLLTLAPTDATNFVIDLNAGYEHVIVATNNVHLQITTNKPLSGWMKRAIVKVIPDGANRPVSWNASWQLDLDGKFYPVVTNGTTHMFYLMCDGIWETNVYVSDAVFQ